MPNWLRALIAGYGAKKLGGGCLSTIIVFVVIYYALGTCNRQQPRNMNNTGKKEARPVQLHKNASAFLIGGKGLTDFNKRSNITLAA